MKFQINRYTISVCHDEAAWHATPSYMRNMGMVTYRSFYEDVMSKDLGSPALAAWCLDTLFSIAWDEMVD